MTDHSYAPGSLVAARGREWVVLGGSSRDTLQVRPVTGSDEDRTLIHLPLEIEPVREAHFPLPHADQLGGHDSAMLLRDALLLSLRRGAGPFRSFGQIAVEPRAYQLVPLLMALKLDPIRLLIADDVGVGKTIEALLIARELLDRGDIERTTVLCPPHLVDQWLTEMEIRFHIQATPVTARSAPRLERGVPPGESIFSIYPHTVVSLDYVKTAERRDNFVQACPDFVMVDEAHTCASSGRGRHQRYELLQALAAKATRHLVLLTATPHSGDDNAFYRLLGLVGSDFQALAHAEGRDRTRLRDRLANHFVQRRRPDIAEWHEGDLFPQRQTMELTYELSGAWEEFFNQVLDYCAQVVETGSGDDLRQRLNFWSTLALLRCTGSSPAAAVQALRTRASGDPGAEDPEEMLDRIFDGNAVALIADDVEPPAGSDDPALDRLVESARGLSGQADDPKLKVTSDHVKGLAADGFNVLVFCRFIATAHYVAHHLSQTLTDVAVKTVTGEYPPEERERRVAEIGAEGSRVLVATDCLSEGINLQDHFDAVVHYDLSWNPTRHEQREGRVDRFGQPSGTVRTTLIYGANNPVDGTVLRVILRKAAKIREELGVPVPVPDEGQKLTQALLKAVLLRGRAAPEEGRQLDLFEGHWEDTKEKAKQSRTVFAQRRINPSDVLPEWHKSLAALGDRDAVQRFASRALARLGSGLQRAQRGFNVPTGALPSEVVERLEAEGIFDTIAIDFSYPAAPGCRPVQRSHPLIAILADTLLGRSLAANGDGAADDPSILGRVGCWISAGVQSRTTVALLRLRHQLMSRARRRETTLMVEEATALAWSAPAAKTPITGTEAYSLLALPPADDPPPHVRRREVQRALGLMRERTDDIETLAAERARTLLDDHLRVRQASRGSGSTTVRAVPRPDVIAAFVLLPKVA